MAGIFGPAPEANPQPKGFKTVTFTARVGGPKIKKPKALRTIGGTR